jgi:hypothetical protein
MQAAVLVQHKTLSFTHFVRKAVCYLSKVTGHDLFPPNVSAEWLALLFRFWEFLASNLGPETCYPD